MTKKLGLIVGMALAALAFAIPVSAASAEEWTHSGEPLEANAEVTLTGNAGFNLIGSETGAEANLDIGLLLEPGTTATITSFVDSNCVGKGELAPFTCTGTAENLPWRAHIVNGQVTITNIRLDTHYYSKADTKHETPVATTLLTGNVILDVDSKPNWGGGLLTPDGLTANGNPATVGGEYTVSPAGTYGLE